MNGGTIGIYTIRDFANPNADGYGTLTGIEKYSQKEFDEHTQSKNEVEVAFTWGDRIRIKKCSGGKSHSDINVTLWYNGVTLRNGGTS